MNREVESCKAASPFLKWAGGKRWLTTRFSSPPQEFTGNYFEPFLGSGAMFFYLQPRSAFLSDANSSLVETYQAIKADHSEVTSYLRTHAAQHCSDYYYQVRAMTCHNEFSRAAKFIYLNRTCWNGLYRVNQQGAFNVPIGTETKVIRCEEDLEKVAKALGFCEISTNDFESQIDRSNEGDMVFADPPYTVRHKHNGFIEYNETLFSWDDQVRLRDSLARAKKRGVKIMLTNADHESIRTLYSTGFSILELSRHSAISGLVSSRGKYSEILIE